MSVATLVTDGFGAFGSIAKVVMLGLEPGGTPPIPPAPVETYSGGYADFGYVPRRRSVQEERERLGILPRKVQKVIKAVAVATVKQEKTEKQAVAQLQQALVKQDIDVQAAYLEALHVERVRIQREIVRSMAIKRRQQELDDEDEDRAVEMLLM